MMICEVESKRKNNRYCWPNFALRHALFSTPSVLLCNHNLFAGSEGITSKTSFSKVASRFAFRWDW